MSQIKITNLNKSFGEIKVLKDINLDINSGEFVVFVGPSGCGKSTLLRCISGLETLSSGDLEIGGVQMNDVSASERGIAMVFQTYALYPHMSVSENMQYSLKIAKIPKQERLSIVQRVAESLHLEDYLDRLPKELSGGQRQRVAIGRAIVRDPKVFLFDEPLSNLDAALRLKMRLEISKLSTDMPDTTMIYVTHDQVEAMTMADRIVVLKDGIVQQVGTPLELYHSPNSLFVAQFIGSPKMNIFSGEQASMYKADYVGIRPENLQIRDEGPWTGELIHAENLGADSYLYIDIGNEDPLTVRQPGTTNLVAGAKVSIAPITDDFHLFDKSGQPIQR
jgi:multiple sugar transport system ATP-binding protein